MRGYRFLTRPLPELSDLERMERATSDTQLSDVCRSIEDRLARDGASIEDWQEYEELKDRHVRRMFSGARAG